MIEAVMLLLVGPLLVAAVLSPVGVHRYERWREERQLSNPRYMDRIDLRLACLPPSVRHDVQLQARQRREQQERMKHWERQQARAHQINECRMEDWKRSAVLALVHAKPLPPKPDHYEYYD